MGKLIVRGKDFFVDFLDYETTPMTVLSVENGNNKIVYVLQGDFREECKTLLEFKCGKGDFENYFRNILKEQKRKFDGN